MMILLNRKHEMFLNVNTEKPREKTALLNRKHEMFLNAMISAILIICYLLTVNMKCF